MPVAYTLHLRARALPDRDWLEGSVRGMEPTFSFLCDFDLSAASADLTSRIATAEAALAWTLTDAPAVPAELASRQYDTTATLQAGPGPAAEIAATVVAGNIALIAHGTVVTPEGERIGPDDALRWASELTRALRKPARKPRVRKAPALPPPGQLLSAWLADLTGAVPTKLVHSLPDDPLTAVRFDTGLRLMLRRWRVSTGEGDLHSTADLPRAMSPAEVERTTRARERLVTLLQSGPVRSGAFDQATLSLRLAFPDGELEVLPASRQYRSAEDRLFRDGDRWELSKDAMRVYPDVDGHVLRIDAR